MIKYVAYSILFVCFLVTPKLSEVRKMYRAVNTSKENVVAFYEKLKNVKVTDNAVLVGYQAASKAIKAKYAKGVKNKKQDFVSAITVLENMLEKHPKNIELRLIRLSIQENSPKLLKYKKNIETDKSFIKSNVKLVKDKNLLEHIKGYVLQSKSFSTAEKNVFSEL